MTTASTVPRSAARRPSSCPKCAADAAAVTPSALRLVGRHGRRRSQSDRRHGRGQVLGKPVVTILGCPPNPYNFLSTVVHFLTFAGAARSRSPSAALNLPIPA